MARPMWSRVRGPRMGAHPAVHVREPRSEQQVLRHGRDAVADEPIEGHAPTDRITHACEPGAERHVGLAGEDRRDQQRDRLRLVLIVRMWKTMVSAPWSSASR